MRHQQKRGLPAFRKRTNRWNATVFYGGAGNSVILEPGLDEPGAFEDLFRSGVGGSKTDQILGQVDDLPYGCRWFFSSGFDGYPP
jgi:hypothetical protein